MKLSDSAYRLSQELENLGGANAARTIAEQASAMQQVSDLERLSGGLAPRSIAERLVAQQYPGACKTVLDALRQNQTEIAARRSPFGHISSAIEAMQKQYDVLGLLRSESLSMLGGETLRALSKAQVAQVDLSRLLNVDTSAMATISQQIKDRLSVSAFVKDTATAQAAFLAEQVTRIQASYSAAMPRATLASELVSSLGVLTSLQDHFPQLRLPALDWVSATAVARLWGTEGMREQLEALGIRDDGTLQDFEDTGSDGASEGSTMHRLSSLELNVLLGIVLVLLVLMYQGGASGVGQQNTLTTHTLDGSVMDTQMRTLDAFAQLVRTALQAEAARSDTRFVVQQRPARVVVSPKAKAAFSGTLLPQQVVSLVSEQGKWIEVRYYSYEHRENRTGWVMKKYLKRVSATRDATTEAAAD